MSLVANNCIRFNVSMDFWLLKEYTAEDLLNNWNDILGIAESEESEENAFFLADCLDVLNEKVKSLTEAEGAVVISRARADLEAISIGESVLCLAG